MPIPMTVSVTFYSKLLVPRRSFMSPQGPSIRPQGPNIRRSSLPSQANSRPQHSGSFSQHGLLLRRQTLHHPIGFSSLAYLLTFSLGHSLSSVLVSTFGLRLSCPRRSHPH